jgi:hypothetical protein
VGSTSRSAAALLAAAAVLLAGAAGSAGAEVAHTSTDGGWPVSASPAGAVAWIEGESTAFARFAPPGGKLGPRRQLGRRDGVADIFVPSVIMGPHGEALAFWDQFSPPASRFVTAFRPPNGTFGPLVPLTTGAQPEVVDAAFDGAGDAVFVWDDEQGGIRVRTRRADGQWSSIERIRTRSTVLQSCLAVAASGAVTVVWVQSARDELADEVVAATRPPGGTFGTARPVARLVYDIDSPMTMASNDRGDAAVVWTENNRMVTGRNPSVHAAFRTGTTGSFRHVAAISRTASPATLPVVSVAPDGGTVLAWQQGRRGVAARIRTPSGRLLPAHLLTKQGLQSTQVSAVAAGPGVVSWFSGDVNRRANPRLQTAVAKAAGGFSRPRTRWSGDIGDSAEQPYVFAVDTGLLIVAPTGEILRSGVEG